MVIIFTKEKVKDLKKQYPRGTRVELMSTTDPYTHLQPGSQGNVRHVDGIGTVHINWDSGSSLGMVLVEDRIKII